MGILVDSSTSKITTRPLEGCPPRITSWRKASRKSNQDVSASVLEYILNKFFIGQFGLQKKYGRMFKHAETWQSLHQEISDQFYSLSQYFSSVETMSNEENFGILKRSKTMVSKIQSNYIEKVEQKISKLKIRVKEYEEISKKLTDIEKEGNHYYERNHENLIIWFNSNPNDSIFLSNLLEGLSEISNSYQNEYKEKITILENLDLIDLENEQQLNNLYRKFINYKYIDIDKIMMVIQTSMNIE
eukprot:gene8840-788_t